MCSSDLHAVGDRGTVVVRDNGGGIPAEVRARLFGPFFTTKGEGGTGLGLYLSRELCEANGIRLEYRADAGHGGCFRLSFPHPDRRNSTVTAAATA